MRPALFIPLLISLISTSARGQEVFADTGNSRSSAMRSEVRLGILRHDPWSGAQGVRLDGRLDLHAQILLPIPQIASASPLVPRMQFGGTLNLAGRTSHAFAGLAWTYDITQKLFAEVAFGGAIVGAARSTHVVQNRTDMGCTAQFREAASLGYKMDGNWSLVSTIEHLSNGGLCTRNRGITNMGVMLGYRF